MKTQQVSKKLSFKNENIPADVRFVLIFDTKFISWLELILLNNASHRLFDSPYQNSILVNTYFPTRFVPKIVPA